MTYALFFTVRFHEGRYHGAGDWPPAPARLFQALMAGAARGAEAPRAVWEALVWLEGLPPPVIAAPRGSHGQALANYVPNNDLDAELAKKATSDIGDAVAAIRVPKSVRPTLFDEGTPFFYCWSVEKPGAEAATLRGAARGVYQLGRGVDMAWAEADLIDARAAEERLSGHGGIVYRPTGGGAAEGELLCPAPGAARSLAARFDGARNRFRTGGTNRKPMRVFAQPPKPHFVKVAYGAPPRRFVFQLRTGDSRGGFAPRRLREASELVREARDKAAARLVDTAPELKPDIERYLIGRGAAGADKAKRVRISPLPSIGHPEADMTIRRVVVHAPQSCPIRADDLAWAFSQVSWADEQGVVLAELQRVEDDPVADRYERAGRRWRSVTPVALPPFRGSATAGSARAAAEAQAAFAARQALRHAGIRVPVARVRVQREPFDRRGARAESFAAGDRFSAAHLWHVMATFDELVKGPLLVGNGRYLGLGLMRPDDPTDPTPGVLAFAILDGLADGADPEAVAHAARRAMMARAQRELPSGAPLPAYVSGHEEDGRPAGGGAHRHVAVAVDLPGRRILFVSPDRLQPEVVRWPEVARDHRLVECALDGMVDLRAGAAGRLRLAAAAVDVESDPLFAPARVWESVTDYRVTRHPRRLADDEAMEADVAAALRRCGRPRPEAVTVLAARRGPRGGLSGRLRLSFAAAQPGPFILGRTMHKGGGLFAGR